MLIIKKKVLLDFLGEDYKDSFIVVRSISVGEYETMQKNKEATVKDTVIDRFVSGQVKQDSGMVDITKDNLQELPGEVFVECFAAMTGADPKSPGLSSSPSSTTPQPPSN